MTTENSEFFMVLPSNTSLERHPNNTASDFTVSLPNPIKLAPKKEWTVALMDMCYSHERIEDCGITYKFYEEWRPVYDYQVTLTYPEHKVVPSIRKFGNTESTMLPIEISFYKEQDLLIVWSKSVAFQLKTGRGTVTTSKYHRFWNQYFCEDDVKASMYFPIKGKPQTKSLNFSIIPYQYIDKESFFPITKQIMKLTRDEIVHYMNSVYDFIFHRLHIKDNIVKFGLGKRVYLIKFSGGLGEALGFGKDYEFTATISEKHYLSTAPNFDRSLNIFHGGSETPHYVTSYHDLNILSNICKLVEVGNTRIPLLKSVSIDIHPTSGSHGYVRNLVVSRPSYMGVRNKTISKIHIDIRNRAGKKVTFQNGSSTVITLHFKCS